MFGLSGLSGYLAIAVVALTVSGYFIFNALVAAKAEITTLEVANKAYVVQIENNKATQKAFELAHNTISLQYQNLEAQTKKDSSREHVAVAKTSAVQKLANKKFKKQEREMACLTGNQSKCSP